MHKYYFFIQALFFVSPDVSDKATHVILYINIFYATFLKLAFGFVLDMDSLTYL